MNVIRYPVKNEYIFICRWLVSIHGGEKTVKKKKKTSGSWCFHHCYVKKANDIRAVAGFILNSLLMAKNNTRKVISHSLIIADSNTVDDFPDLLYIALWSSDHGISDQLYLIRRNSKSGKINYTKTREIWIRVTTYTNRSDYNFSSCVKIFFQRLMFLSKKEV